METLNKDEGKAKGRVRDANPWQNKMEILFYFLI